MRGRLVIILIATLALIGGAVTTVLAQGPTNTELDADIAQVHKQVEEAQRDSRTYGGVVGMYATLRVQILKDTEAMLQQKKFSFLRGITIVFKDPVLRLPEQTAKENDDFDRQIAKIQAQKIEAQAEADQYTGGLLKALALARVSMAKNTIAALEQAKLLKQYGIPMPVIPTSGGKSEVKPQPPGEVVHDKDAL